MRKAFPGLAGRSLEDHVVREPLGHCLSYPYISRAVRLNEEARDARQAWAADIPSRHRRLWETDARIGQWIDILKEALSPDHRDTAFSVAVSSLVEADLEPLRNFSAGLTVNSLSYVVIVGHDDMVFMAETIVEDPTPYQTRARQYKGSLISALLGGSGPREWTRTAMIPCETGTGVGLSRALATHLGGTKSMSTTDVFNMVGFASEAPFHHTEVDGSPADSVERTVLSAMKQSLRLRLTDRDRVGLEQKEAQRALDDLGNMSLADAWG